MPIDHWFAFVAASAIMLAIPRPTVLLIISYTLGYGRKPALAVTAGAAVGGLTIMSTSMLGLGALLAASSALFTGLRWLGGAYHVFMAIKLWRAPIRHFDDTSDDVKMNHIRMFVHAYTVTTLNPKGVVFFVAFAPQFIVPEKSFIQQAVVLISTFVVLDLLDSTVFLLLASAARLKLRKPRVQRVVNRSGGSLLIGAGIIAAGWKRATA